MKAGLFWTEPALRRFIYRDLKDSNSSVNPKHALAFHADHFPWEAGDDDVDFETIAHTTLGEVVLVERREELPALHQPVAHHLHPHAPAPRTLQRTRGLVLRRHLERRVPHLACVPLPQEVLDL